MRALALCLLLGMVSAGVTAADTRSGDLDGVWEGVVEAPARPLVRQCADRVGAYRPTLRQKALQLWRRYGDVAAAAPSRTTKASKPPALVPWTAPIAGKSVEDVSPTTIIVPEAPTATDTPASSPLPPR